MVSVPPVIDIIPQKENMEINGSNKKAHGKIRVILYGSLIFLYFQMTSSSQTLSKGGVLTRGGVFFEDF